MTLGDIEISTDKDIEMIYENSHSHEKNMHEIENYSYRHNIRSAQILTVTEKRHAFDIADRLKNDIYNKTVVEIGAGVGMVALALGQYAKKVIAIEASPSWSWVFTKNLIKYKPPHVTWIFGDLNQVSEYIRGDVAVILTHSGQKHLILWAAKMCPRVIDYYAYNEELKNE